jgi:hypothetical protein
MRIEDSVFGWVLSRAEAAVKSTAMDTAAKLEYNLLALAMCRRPQAHFATGTAE